MLVGLLIPVQEALVATQDLASASLLWACLAGVSIAAIGNAAFVGATVKIWRKTK